MNNKQIQQVNKSKKHWFVAIICSSLAMTVVGLPINAGGVFFTPVAESLGVMQGAFSIHSTLTLIGAAIISLFVPRLIRKFNLKPVLTVGILLASVTNILMGFAQSLPQFYILGSLRGLGSGLIAIVPLTMIINEWFHKHHGLVTSVILSFTGIAGAVFSPIFSYLIGTIGWQMAYIIMGISMLVGSIPAIIYPFSLNPREDGLLPYGYNEKNEKSNKVGKNKVVTENISKSLLVYIVILAVLLTMITGLPQHFPGYAQTINQSLSVGSMMLSAAMLGNIVFKVLFGILSDRLGPTKTTVLMIGINILSIVFLLTVSNVSNLVLVSFFFGTIYSLPAVGITLMTKEFFGTRQFNKVYPIISFSTAIGGAISISLIGYIYDFARSYIPAFVISLLFHVINLILTYLATRQIAMKEEKIGSKKTLGNLKYSLNKETRI